MSDPPRDETIAGDTGQVIRSPEQVELHLPVAGPTSRILAYAVDRVIVTLVELGLIVLYGLAVPDLVRRIAVRFPRATIDPMAHLPGVFLAVLLIVTTAIELVYFMFWDFARRGQSPGKAALGLRVVTEEGFPIDGRSSLVRNLLRAVDILPGMYVIGLIAMVASRRTQRLGDMAAGTLVVRLDRPPPAPPLADEAAPGDATFRLSPAQLARLGTTETTLVRETLRRLDTLPPEQAKQVLERSVEALRTRLEYGPIAADDRVPFLRALLRAARLR